MGPNVAFIGKHLPQGHRLFEINTKIELEAWELTLLQIKGNIIVSAS